MSVDFPKVYAVVALADDVRGKAEKLYEGRFLMPEAAVDFVVGTEDFHLQRLDDPDNALIVADQAGGKTMYLAWGHPHDPLSQDFLVVMACPLSRDLHGNWMYKPAAVLRGDLADVVVVGGMSCCGNSLQAHWSEIAEEGDALSLIDEPRAPAALPNAEHQNWLKGKIRVAGDALNPHIMIDIVHAILAHRGIEGFDKKPDLAKHGLFLSGAMGHGPKF